MNLTTLSFNCKWEKFLTCRALGHMQFSEELSPVWAASAEDSVPVGLELVLLLLLLLLLGAPMAMA